MIDYWRQLHIISPSELTEPITVIGVGGIGSFTAFVLEKMGCQNLILYDDDIVEPHNPPNQLFRKFDVNIKEPKLKVEAQREIAADFSDSKVEAINERFDGSQKLSRIVVSGVDDMDEREKIWKAIVYNPNVHLYIDGRMAREVAYIYVIQPCDPDDVDFYEKTLHSNEEAMQVRCTEQAIIDVVFVTAGLIANEMRKFIKGEEVSRHLIYDAKNMMLINRKR